MASSSTSGGDTTGSTPAERRTISRDGELDAKTMRLAGTASQYSKKAMPQLIRTTIHSGLAPNFRWPYQAKVMKTFDRASMTMGAR